MNFNKLDPLFESGSTRHDFGQLRGDLRLSSTVEVALQGSTKASGVVGCGLHGHHSHHLLTDHSIIDRFSCQIGKLQQEKQRQDLCARPKAK